MFDSWKIDSQGAAGLSRSRYLLAACGTVALAALAAMVFVAPSARAQAGAPSGDGVQPLLVAGNPSCETLNASEDPKFASITSNFGFKLNGSPSGTFDLDESDGGELTGGAPSDPNNSVTISDVVNNTFDWAATLGIDAVIVKGGDNADAFVYDPEDLADTNLHPPLNTNTPNPNDYFGISHIEFCYDYELDVSKTADASFDRTYDWDIAKSNDGNDVDDPAVVNAGDPFVVNYEVTVGLDDPPFADSNWAVDGTITVKNNTPLDATIESVDDVLNGNNPTPDCGVTFPYVLGDGETLNCTYDATGLDGTEEKNTVDVTTSGAVGGDSAEAPIDWENADISEFDECITVTDDKTDPSNPVELGTVCLGDLDENDEYTFTYSKTFEFSDPEDCGEQSRTNTATFVSNDEGDSGEAMSTVNFLVLCDGDGGCSLTPGYWKTHSREGPAPYDSAWQNLGSDEEDTKFFLNGTYYEALWTPPAGNAYYVLAHAYIAAVLNGLNGADTSEVDDEIAAAEALFGTYTPAQIGAKRGSQPPRPTFLALAKTLDDYNNGIIGPGHCTDDGTAA